MGPFLVRSTRGAGSGGETNQLPRTTLSLYTVPYDQVSFSCLYSTPNVDVRHKAGIRIDSLDPLIHRFPDGLSGFVGIVSLKSKGSGVRLTDLIIRKSLSVR